MTLTSDLGATFDLAPVPMWVEDFSQVRLLLDAWRADGVEDLRGWLQADLARVAQAVQLIRVLQVNAATLELYEAQDQQHLIDNLPTIFGPEMLTSHVEELCQLWQGGSSFQSTAINYTITGRRLSIQLKARALPGSETDLSRMLMVTEDVTMREAARSAERESRLAAEGLFRHSPVSLWIEDFSVVKEMLAGLRARGISDLRVFTDVHPEFIRQCMQAIRLIDVNEATLEMFLASSREELLRRLGEVMRDDMEPHFREQLIELWNGNLHHSREVVNYALDGSDRVVIMRFAVMPGHQRDWGRVLIALTDITARKKAEAYLSWLGKHDVLTGLNNRAHFIETLNSHMRQGVMPLSVAMVDLDGLKQVNDQIGHDAGDGLLRRTGEVLREALQDGRAEAARIGGDEFAIVMPGHGEMEANAVIKAIEYVVAVNNSFYSARPLVLSIGVATLEPGESHDAMLRRADAAMYREKRAHRDSANRRD